MVNVISRDKYLPKRIGLLLNEILTKAKFRKSTLPKALLALFGLLLFFLYYQHRRNQFTVTYKPTPLNEEIRTVIEPLARRYSPSFHLPSAVLQMWKGEKKTKENLRVEFGKENITLSHGAKMCLEWYPVHASDLPQDRPVIVFMLGVSGNSINNYCREFAKQVNRIGWRFVVVNRVGFGSQMLESAHFMSQQEHHDFHEAILAIKGFFCQAPLYLAGVSAGANNVCRYLGNFPEAPLIAASSISNGFNVARVSFAKNYNPWTAFFSRHIAKYLSKSFARHLDNPHFNTLMNPHFSSKDEIREVFSSKKLNCWQLDKKFTSKISGHSSIYEYYSNVSCEFVIDKIRTPLLVINNLEDPICLKEVIPVEKLFQNPNIFTILFERGGHIEYFSGWNEEWFGYTLTLEYFQMFERKRVEEAAVIDLIASPNN